MAHLLPLVLRLGLLLALGLGDRSPLLPSLQKQEKSNYFQLDLTSAIPLILVPSVTCPGSKLGAKDYFEVWNMKKINIIKR